tara:strand:- start:6312 stop:7943 length:1632 start_codon:yes stop_codon:yes gene_type:complete
MTLELSRLKPNDYEILDSGNYRIPGKVTGVDSPEFGLAVTDYIEMVISTPTGVFLDSFVIARGSECTQYKTLDENNEQIFSINPGIFMREKGYFSGEYNIEFNFLREVAGSEQGVLVDKENKIYNGTYFVSNKGLIYKGGEVNIDELEKDEFLLREKDYKFYVDEISADRTEVRLATLPIKSGRYNTEFKGLGSDEIVLDYKETLQDIGDKLFEIPSLQSNTLPQNIIGGELVIRDAYKVPGLNINKDTFDALAGIKADTNHRDGIAGLHTYGMSLKNVSQAVENQLLSPGWKNKRRHSAVYGGDNDYYANTITDNFFGDSADGNKRSSRQGYDTETIMRLVNADDNTGIRNLLFRDIGTGIDGSYNLDARVQTFIDLKKENPDDRFYDGAAIIGWTSYSNYGFPLWIRCNSPDLTKFISGDGLNTSLTIRVSGRSTTTDLSGQHRTYDVEEYNIDFNGKNSFLKIPRHNNYQTKDKVGGNNQDDVQGAVFDVEIDFNLNFTGIERTYTILKPSTFCVVPDDDSGKAKQHMESGFNSSAGGDG